jgi:effector-binding domain-containing protein
METDCVTQAIPRLHYVGIRRRAKPWQLGDILGEILPAVAAYLREQKIPIASPPMMLYHAHLEEEQEFEIQGGFFVGSPAPKHERFESGIIPEGEAVVTRHIGPYDKLGDAHDRVRAFAEAAKRRPFGPCWEVYLTDPGEVLNPEEYITEVVQPIR